MRVSNYQSWIDQFLDNAPDCSADGLCNPACPSGEDPDCQTATDCGNNICDPNESCDGRDGTFECLQDCPGKTKGKPSTRYCFVGETCLGPACP